MTSRRAASIHDRLLHRARERGEDFNLLLTRYAVERFLYRLTESPEREQYLLKGALLFDLWFDTPHRPTRDADFLGFGLGEEESLKRSVQMICAVAADDGMVFDPESIIIEEIREDTRYGGLRVRLIGYLGSARCTVQLDVGYGDAVTPAPEEAIYPTLLTGSPAPHLKVYPRASVMSEKLESIVCLGMGNSRMKDYFDLRALAKEGKLDVHELADAIANTHRRRGTALPGRIPLGLSEEFAAEPSKRAQWQAFLTKNRIDAPELEQVVSEIREFIAEPLHLARSIIAFRG